MYVITTTARRASEGAKASAGSPTPVARRNESRAPCRERSTSAKAAKKRKPNPMRGEKCWRETPGVLFKKKIKFPQERE